eukprot:621429-Hanusia_phi.AAC.1
MVVFCTSLNYCGTVHVRSQTHRLLSRHRVPRAAAAQCDIAQCLAEELRNERTRDGQDSVRGMIRACSRFSGLSQSGTRLP